jgi:hypothetical protein
MNEDEKPLLKPGDGNIKKSSATFAGAYQATPEQLTPKKEGEPPSAASLSIADKIIEVLERRLAELELYDEVRAHKPPDDDAE